MNWQAVESSQIAEVGFQEPSTLGVRFKTKTGTSEYHYSNVTVGIFQRLMAAKSIGTYFGQNIKPFPEKYPFVKVEANPTLPATSPASSASTTTKPNGSATKSTGSTDGEIVSPVTSLAVIDTLENSALFASGGVTDAQLAAGREWYLANAPKSIATEEERLALKRFARPLQKLRTSIEARAKEYTGETKRTLARIDTEKRRLIQIVGGIEQEVLRPNTEWEQEEEARKTRLAGIQNKFALLGQTLYADIPSLEAAIKELESFDTSTMQEYKIGTESTIAASLKVLKPELARRKEAEAQAAELAQLRAEAAERKRKDEIAAAARELIANQTAALTAPAIYVETPSGPGAHDDGIMAASMATGFHSPAAVEAQQEFRSVESDTNAVKVEAVQALLVEVELEIEQAEAVIDVIAKGLIPHVTITH
jgi:hypothetical protein